MEIAITKISSKGQIVIPAEMRKDIPKGEKMLIIKSGSQLIIKRASDLDKNLKQDLEFARRTEQALKRYKKRKFKGRTLEEFSKELEKW